MVSGPSFERVAALDEERAVGDERIAALLAGGRPTQAGSSGPFTGRPSTVLVADEALVLKKRCELRYRPGDQERWIRQAVERERALRVHHPAKTWLVLDGDEESVIANVMPRLDPLDQWLPGAGTATGLAVIERLLRMYTDAFVRHERQLDPGLSNFGTDAAGRLYYLDDESSPARGLASLAATIASWFRVLPWADAAAGAALGAQLRRLVLDGFGDPHPAIVIRDQLRAAFAADERQAAAIAAVQQELVPARRPAAERARSEAAPEVPTGPRRYLALLADVHGNLRALERALEHVDGLGDAELWVLGDIVGYGPEPAACLERLRAREDAVIIKGNHDHAVALGRAGRGFSPLARQLVDWTVGALSEEQRNWLMELPPVHADDGWLAVHGAPQDPTYFNGYVYHMTYADNLDVLAARGLPYCVHGHTHVAGAYRRRGHRYGFVGDSRIDLEGADNWLICPGSVGQPRSGRPEIGRAHV